MPESGERARVAGNDVVQMARSRQAGIALRLLGLASAMPVPRTELLISHLKVFGTYVTKNTVVCLNEAPSRLALQTLVASKKSHHAPFVSSPPR